MPPAIKPLLARGMVILLVASALGTAAEMGNKSLRAALKHDGPGKVERVERSLASLMPLIQGRRTIGLLSWHRSPAKLFEIQYVLAPTLVRRELASQDLLLVELGPGQQVDMGQQGWRLVARSQDRRYLLLSRATGQGEAVK